MEDSRTRCSLPSISNLLEMVDAGSLKAGAATSSSRSSLRSDAHALPVLGGPRREPPFVARKAYRKATLPPMPPQSMDMSFDNHLSPHRSHVALDSSQGRPYYGGGPTSNADSARRHAANDGRRPRHDLHPSQLALYLFPQSQARYICPTCHKAFSRPSGLRIHSHSHTGEKPFRCSYPGCGRAFSVRSNMKRHERGWHGVGATKKARASSAYAWPVPQKRP